MKTKQITLPAECIYFVFMQSQSLNTWLCAVLQDSIWCIDVETKEVFQKIQLQGVKEFNLLGHLGIPPSKYQLKVDVDHDGNDDIIYPSSSSLRILRQNSSRTLEHEGRVSTPMKFFSIDAYIDEISTTPRIVQNCHALWLEPEMFQDLSNLTILSSRGGELFVYKQLEPCVFIHDHTVTLPGHLIQRQVVKCCVNSKNINSILENIIYESDNGSIQNEIKLISPKGPKTMLTLQSNPYLIQPIDIDKDGPTELLVLRPPRLENAVGDLLQGTNLNIFGKFICVDQDGQNFRQLSDEFKMTYSLAMSQQKTIYDIYKILQDQTIINQDFNSDGAMDIAWAEGKKVIIRLFNKKKGKINLVGKKEIILKQYIKAIFHVDIQNDGISEILVECYSSDIIESDKKNMHHYYLLHTQ